MPLGSTARRHLLEHPGLPESADPVVKGDRVGTVTVFAAVVVLVEPEITAIRVQLRLHPRLIVSPPPFKSSAIKQLWHATR
jgi:hypothetical protein